MNLNVITKNPMVDYYLEDLSDNKIYFTNGEDISVPPGWYNFILKYTGEHNEIEDIKINGEINLSFSGREVSQKISGWLVIDQEKRSFQFLCEEKLLIEPYVEQVAKQSKRIIFGVDLNDGIHLVSQLKLLKNNESYKVWKAETNELMLTVIRSDQTLKVENNVAFTFSEMDGSELPKGERFWCRNGIILYDTGEVQTEGSYTCHLTIDSLH